MCKKKYSDQYKSVNANVCSNKVFTMSIFLYMWEKIGILNVIFTSLNVIRVLIPA